MYTTGCHDDCSLMLHHAEAKPEQAGQPHPQCLALRETLLASIQAAQLPPNFLDELVDALGSAQNVAEMTGAHSLNH